MGGGKGRRFDLRGGKIGGVASASLPESVGPARAYLRLMRRKLDVYVTCMLKTCMLKTCMLNSAVPMASVEGVVPNVQPRVPSLQS